MNVEFPKKLKVGSITYDIVFPAEFPAVSSYRGMHKGHEGTIELIDNGDPRINWKVFMHELVHAIDFVFCDKYFDEFETELISNILISLVLDNDSLFNNNKIPDSIRIFGLHYNIIKDYAFPEIDNTAAIVKPETGDIFLADPKLFNFSDDFMKLQLFYCIVELIPRGIFVQYNEDFVKDFPISQFANGLLEVFREYDFETVLKEVFLK